MHIFDLRSEQRFDRAKHVEKLLGKIAEGDVSVACWEPGQISPNHCHPDATEIYFCFEGGGTMRVPTRAVRIEAGAFVVHPPGELHEFENGPQRTLLFRVRYGQDMSWRVKDWTCNPTWRPSAADTAYFLTHPFGETMPDEAAKCLSQ